jgi:hypothetical protein
MPDPARTEDGPAVLAICPGLVQHLVPVVEELADLQDEDGSVPAAAHARAGRLVRRLAADAPTVAEACGQTAYADALFQDLLSWANGDLSAAPDFACSRDAIVPPPDGTPFFFLGPLRLANGARTGFRFETFLSLREEPSDPAYLELYRRFPHPANICQSSHLLAGSRGLTRGNNIVFFPENIRASTQIERQRYAIFFFNKFHRIFNEVTWPAATAATRGLDVANPTRTDPRACYKARCVWGYLHDYFHHQGARPFDTQVAIKTRWFTGLLEEIKVDLQSYLACVQGDIVDGTAVAEFILLDRAFRYPLEPDWYRNFDSGTGLILLSVLHQEKAVTIEPDGRIALRTDEVAVAAERFIARVEALEQLDDAAYVAGARDLVRHHLPQTDRPGARFDRPAELVGTVLAGLASDTPRGFSRADLTASLAHLTR